MISNLFNIESKRILVKWEFDENTGTTLLSRYLNHCKESLLGERMTGEKHIPYVELKLRRSP